MRLTRRVFHDLAIWMVAFGLGIGLVFPFFVILLGVPGATARTPVFMAACLGAGALAGAVNYSLAHWVVGVRLRLLASRMNQVERNLHAMAFTNNLSACTPEACSIPPDSEDEMGDAARAFNRLVEALADSMHAQAALRSFSDLLTSQLAIDNLADQALQHFCTQTGASGGAVLYESAGELKVAAARGLLQPERLAVSDHVRTAARTGERQLVAIPDDVRVEGVVIDFQPREVLVLPARYKSVLVGVVVLATGRRFEADHVTRVEPFLQGLALAMNNAIAHDRLQRLAALDPLTGVYNRRFGLGRLREEFGRAVRGKTPLGVLVLDVDAFKTINDTYGHLVGDRVLKSVCAAARTALREGDVLLRYGGDEFVAILPAASADDLFIVGERLRRAVADTSLTEGEQAVRVTVSIGAAACRDHAVEHESVLLEMADAALYRAKQRGRNCVDVSRDGARAFSEPRAAVAATALQ